MVIAPWEIGDLPEEWLEGAKVITTRLATAMKAQKVIDQRMEAWRASHPTYRKHQ